MGNGSNNFENIHLSVHADPLLAHLEPSHQVTVKARVDPSPSTRWSFLISVCTRLQQNTAEDSNGIMQMETEYTHDLHCSMILNQATVVQKKATVS